MVATTPGVCVNSMSDGSISSVPPVSSLVPPTKCPVLEEEVSVASGYTRELNLNYSLLSDKLASKLKARASTNSRSRPQVGR